MRLPEPGDAARAFGTVDVDIADMVRLSRSPLTEPFHASDGLFRFDDPLGRAVPAGVGRASFKVLYLADSIETAFCESVLHGVALFAAGCHQVPRSALQSRSVVMYCRPARPLLTLVDLSGDALKRAGLTNDISAGDDYRCAQAWSQAIHREFPQADGIRAMSRQRQASYCYAVFDRAGVLRDDHCPLPPDLLDRLCAQFNVAPVQRL